MWKDHVRIFQTCVAIFEKQSFVSWALSIVITSYSSAICGVLSMNSQVQVLIQLQPDDERTPTHCSIIIDLRPEFFVRAEVFAFQVTHL